MVFVFAAQMKRFVISKTVETNCESMAAANQLTNFSLIVVGGYLSAKLCEFGQNRRELCALTVIKVELSLFFNDLHHNSASTQLQRFSSWIILISSDPIVDWEKVFHLF